MANNRIQFKRTSTSGLLPNTTNSANSSYISAGEFAVNLTDKRVVSSNGSATFEVGANVTNQTVTNQLDLTTNGAKITFAANGAASGNVSYLTLQTDNNFVFYQTYTDGSARPIWASFTNSNTAPFSVVVPLKVSSALQDSSGSNGASGQVLTSNGTAVYWAAAAGGGGINTAAQYTWTNTQTFSANVSFSDLISITNGKSLYLNGLADANWRIGRGIATYTKAYYTNSSMDFLIGSSSKEGITFGNIANTSFLEMGSEGNWFRANVAIGNVAWNSMLTVNGTVTFANSSSNTFNVYANGQVAAREITGSGSATFDTFASTNNGNGTNFKVGDDAWIGDINTADTLAIRGQQSANNGYIVFGNADTTSKLGRSGTGPLTYTGIFSTSGNSTSYITTGNSTQNTVVNATGFYVNGVSISSSFSNGTAYIWSAVQTFNANISLTGNTTNQIVVGSATINATTYSGTANNATNLGGISLATLQGQITGNAATAYSNAVANAAALYQTTAGLSANVATLTANAAGFLGNSSGTIANITSWITGNSATAYSNATSYADTKAATAYSNATVFASNASNINTGTVAAARLGSGTANSTTILYGNNVWAAPPDVNTAAQYSWTNAHTFGTNVTISSATNGVGLTVSIPSLANSAGTRTWQFGTQTGIGNPNPDYFRFPDGTYQYTAWTSDVSTLTANAAGYLSNSSGTLANITSWITGNAATAYTNATNYTTAGGYTVTGAVTYSNTLSANALFIASNGSKISVMGGQNGTSDRGIFLWTYTDTNWGIYIANGSANVSLANTTPPAGLNGSTSWAVRFRAANGSPVDNAGWIWENHTDVAMMQLEPTNGNLYVRGTVNAAGFAGNLTGTAANATNLNSQPASYYTNATNINTGTLPVAQLPANIVFWSNSNSFTADQNFIGNASFGNATSNAVIFSNSVGTYFTGVSYTANNANNLGGTSLSTLQSQITGNAATAYSNAVANAAALYQTTAGLSANVATLAANSATYLGNSTTTGPNIASWITGNSATAYTNATVFASNASNINTGTLAEARLPYRMNQNVSSNSSVEFVNVYLTGNLTVGSNVNVIGANNYSVTDNMIYLNANATYANPDIGITAGYNDGSYHHTGFFRDHTNGIWKVFDGYDPEPDASIYIDQTNSSFKTANFMANVYYAGNNTVYATVNSTIYTGTANNANNLGGAAANVYVNTSGAFTLGGVITLNANLIISNTSAVMANGTYGGVGQALLSNGSAVYWGDVSSTLGPVVTFNYTFDSNTTVITGVDNFGNTFSYRNGRESVFLNGSRLIKTLDYNTTNSTAITLVANAVVNDQVQIFDLGQVTINTYTYAIANNTTLIAGSDYFSNTLSYTANAENVFLNGLKLKRGTDYSTTNSTAITLTSNAVAGDYVQVVGMIGNYTEYDYTIAANTSVISGLDDNSKTLSYTPGQEILFLNGLKLIAGQDYATINSSFVAFKTGLAINDVVSIVAFNYTSAQDNDLFYNTNTAYVSTATTQIVDVYKKDAYNTVKYFVTVESTLGYQSSELLVLQNGTTAYSSEYGMLYTNNQIASFSANVVGSNVNLIATTTGANNIINVKRIPVGTGSGA